MTSSRLDCAVTRYKNRLQLLNNATLDILKLSTPDASKEESSSKEELTEKQHQLQQQILAVLAARDEVQSALQESTQTSGKNIATIVQLDRDLKQNLTTLTQQDHDLSKQSKSRTNTQSKTPVIQLADWRASVNPKQEAWWWFFEAPQPEHWWNHLDWLCRTVSVACLTISLSLVGDISTRFLTGGPDFLGTLAVSTQSVLTLLAGGSLLTQEGRQAAKNILSSLIPKGVWSEAGAVSSILLLLLLTGFRLSLPQIAAWYNDWGFKHYNEGRWSSAEFDYNRALKLNQDYAEAHFSLGLLYEDLQEVDKARTQYQLALQAGHATAYNNLARLYILNKNYSAAVSLLLKTLDPTKKINLDDETKQLIFKNLGWARLNQKRYVEAEFYLQEAINLQKSSRLTIKRAALHCLLAQVLEEQKKQKEALKEWEVCLATANINNPDEDAWSAMASQRLEVEKDHP